MRRFLKAAFISLLSLGLILQGLSIFVLAPSQPEKFFLADGCSAVPAVVVSMTVPLDAIDDCCSHVADRDEPLEKELPVFWELDTHDITIAGLNTASLGNAQFPTKENHFYPPPSYVLHRPPDLLT